MTERFNIGNPLPLNMRDATLTRHLLTEAEASRIPAIYETDGVPMAEKVAHARYFFGGRAAFYVLERATDTGEMFGFWISEHGNDLNELTYATPQAMREVRADKDCLFTPKNLIEAIKSHEGPRAVPDWW